MGSISRRGKNSWQLRFDTTPISGKRQRHHLTVRGTYKDAQRALTQALAAVDAGTHVDPSQMTLGEYLIAWFEGASRVSPKTRERYSELADQQVAPHLGSVRLQRLRPEHLERWHGTLLDAGLSPRTVTNAHSFLSGVLRHAVENGTLSRNVAAIRRPPAVEQEEIEILTADEIAEVRAKLVGRTPLAEIVKLALATGMRRGELLGLMWGDIDLDRGTLRVERSVEETKAGLRTKSPKTRRGRRNLTLGDSAVAVLRAYRVKQLELRLVIGLGRIEPTTLVFSTVEGELLRPRNITKAWSRVMPGKQFHSLRHTHASLCLGAGVDVITVSRRLGHSNASITLTVYGHLIAGADAAAAKAIEGVLK